MIMKTVYFSFFLLAIPFFGLAQKTIHLASNGNNSNNGLSAAAPIKTTAHLNTINLSAGDKVLFCRGDVFEGQVEVKNIRLLCQNKCVKKLH